MKVMTIDMSVDTEHALEDGLDQHGELLREGSTDLGGEDIVVVEEILNPVHQMFDVVGGW